ncbi:MAG TPA: hypothetical protein VNN20_06860 [Thermodesulfobacteriota bacterium]|nr:hypothetical protein [Thermodesulfobacteriota bacterium]
MQHDKVLSINRLNLFLSLAVNPALFLFVYLFLSANLTLSVNAASKKVESPEDVVVVKDYKWLSGGMGQAAILKDITLENKGKKDYKNLQVEVELFTTNDIPLGSLRSTIHETLPAGSENTFHRVNFGIMHSPLEKTVLRIVSAETIEQGPPGSPKDLILVKDWQWTGGQYGTEAILKEITLENKSGQHYKDIKIKVDNLGVGGSSKVGYEGYTSRIVIHDVLPAGSTKTFNNINVGFKHPDTKNSHISVSDAVAISTKELNYRLAEKEGKPVKKRYKKVAKKTTKEKSEAEAPASGETSSEKSSLSLSERYRQKLAQKTEEPSIPEASEVRESKAESPTKTEGASEEEIETVTATEEEAEVEENGGIMGSVSKLGKRIVGIFKGDSEEYVEEDRPSAREEELEEEGEVAVTPGEAATVREVPEEEEEEEVAIPRDDILVKAYTWAGGGVPGTVGVLDEIVLENRSGITYTNILLSVEFFAESPRRPMGSNRVTVNEVLPPYSEKVLRRVKIGYLNTIPDEIDIKVIDASAIR